MNLAPHKCPVCEGRGTVPGEFYDFHPSAGVQPGDRVECHTCEGEGILWPPFASKLRESLPDVFNEVQGTYYDYVQESVEAGLNPNHEDFHWWLGVDTLMQDRSPEGALVPFADLRAHLDTRLWAAVEPMSLRGEVRVLTSEAEFDQWIDEFLVKSDGTATYHSGPVPSRNVPSADEIDSFRKMVDETITTWRAVDQEGWK